MKSPYYLSRLVCMAMLLASIGLCGCQAHHMSRGFYQPPPPSPPLGTITDGIWKAHEARAEASDFVIYNHEFRIDSVELNRCGQDHIKQIALRLQHNPRVPVIVERSLHAAKEDTEFGFEVHADPELDNNRREIVVRYLTALGVPNADRRVVVSTALATPSTATESLRAYQRGLQGNGFNGGFGGFGLGGGLGGTRGIGGFGF